MAQRVLLDDAMTGYGIDPAERVFTINKMIS
jgi:hypothetical protein